MTDMFGEMDEILGEIAHKAQAAAKLGADFTIVGFIYLDTGGAVQVIRLEWKGGALPSWSETLAAQVQDSMPKEGTALMFRWQIQFGPLSGNVALPAESGPQ